VQEPKPQTGALDVKSKPVNVLAFFMSSTAEVGAKDEGKEVKLEEISTVELVLPTSPSKSEVPEIAPTLNEVEEEMAPLELPKNPPILEDPEIPPRLEELTTTLGASADPTKPPTLVPVPAEIVPRFAV
jgi:hypothetical protein